MEPQDQTSRVVEPQEDSAMKKEDLNPEEEEDEEEDREVHLLQVVPHVNILSQQVADQDQAQ